MVCCVNKYTEAEMVVPNTLLTALGMSFISEKGRADDRCFVGFDTQLQVFDLPHRRSSA